MRKVYGDPNYIKHGQTCNMEICPGCFVAEPDSVATGTYKVPVAAEELSKRDRMARRLEIESICREVMEEYRELFEKLSKT